MRRGCEEEEEEKGRGRGMGEKIVCVPLRDRPILLLVYHYDLP